MADSSLQQSQGLRLTNIMQYLLVFVMLVAGVSLMANPPVLIGPPLENAGLTLMVYLSLSLLWIPAFIMVSRRRNQEKSKLNTHHRQRLFAGFGALLVIYTLLFVLLFERSPLRLLNTSNTVICETQTDTDGVEQFQCVGTSDSVDKPISCGPETKLIFCAPGQINLWRIIFSTPEGSFFNIIEKTEGPYFTINLLDSLQ